MVQASLVENTPPSPPLEARHSVCSTPHSRGFAAYQTCVGGTYVIHCIVQNKMKNLGGTRNKRTPLADDNVVENIQTIHIMV